MLAAAGLMVTGLGMVLLNPCFFAQFPPAGCPVASVDPPGTSRGWVLFLVGGLLLSVTLLTAYAASSPEARQASSQARREKRESRRAQPTGARRDISSGPWTAKVKAVTPKGTPVTMVRCCQRGHATPDLAAAHAEAIAERIAKTGR
ncbi:MAG: hypothetical protein ACLQDY_05510 [Streptosporangiaceae bacterium]